MKKLNASTIKIGKQYIEFFSSKTLFQNLITIKFSKSDRLACDRTINGNKTFTCGRVYGEFCQVYEDCANGLQCGAPSYTCECQVYSLLFII